ncbi:helix-turn-helix domain-containing protein [Vagococcus entomophilus]|uniref:HTH araC/xylS-type domain-containing protein n=1 Tax=Vagococcus entomophilus TaxID=1160095 RepID=A0A430AF93_9ENTE|nr:helix-turn-helix domain-containing protein [Vagococcus entomophilus]RSU06417.1 hypothetical protein CBF30_09185 [Vagococcus entomophilus]
MDQEYETIYLDAKTNSYLFKFFSQDTKRIIPMHVHKEIELLYCVSGCLKIWIGGEIVVLKQNEFYVINSLVPHATQSLTENEVIVLYLSESFLKDENVQVDISSKKKETAEYQVTVDTIKEVEVQHEQVTEYLPYLQKSLIHKLQYLLLRFFSQAVDETSERKRIQNEKVSRVIKIIQDNYTKELTLAKLSRLSGYSMNYLSRMFHQYTGQTFIEYKRSLCLEAAIKMMDATDLSLEEISIRSGFPNEKSMRMYFKTMIGVTPRKYKMLKNDRK